MFAIESFESKTVDERMPPARFRAGEHVMMSVLVIKLLSTRYFCLVQFPVSLLVNHLLPQ